MLFLYTKYTLTYLFSPWSRVLVEKVTGFQRVKKFPAFYGPRRFITAVTSARHLSLSWASLIQSIPPYPTSWRTILILSSHLRLSFPSGLFPAGFPTKTLYTPLLSPVRATCPAHLILLDFITRTILGEDYRSLSSSLRSFLHYPHFFPLMPKYSPQHPRPTFLPQIRSIHNLVNKLETTGSLMGKEPVRKRIVLTEQKLDTTGAQHEMSPRKCLK